MPNSDRLVLEIRRSARAFTLYVGLVVAGAIGFFVIAHNLTFRRPWEGYNTYRAAFTDVKGIVPNKHEVRISGVPVGVVSASEVVDGHPVLTLKIKKKYGKLYRNARLRIRPVTPLQDLFVNVVSRGTPAAGVAGGSYVLPTDNDISPVDISRVLDTFDADTRQRLAIMLREFGAGLSDRGATLREAFTQSVPFLQVARQAAHELSARRRNLARLVHNFSALTGALGTRDDQLTRLVRGGQATLGELAKADAPLGATIGALPPTMSRIRTSFAALRGLTGDLDPAMRSLQPVASSLGDGLHGLARLGTEATPALARLRPAVRQLRPLATAAAPTASSLDGAFASLRPQAPRFDELTREVETCKAKVQTFFQHTLEVFKYADGNGAFPRAEMTADTDGPSVIGLPQLKGANLRRLPSCTDSFDKAKR